MHPGTLISLFFLIGITVIICLLALIFPKKFRKLIWVISCLIFIIVAGFYSVRPFIVENQTTEAKEELNNYLDEKYPEESWKIADTDEYLIQTDIILHVIFENEQNIVYEYVVNDKTIKQVDMWLKSGDSDWDSDIELQHYEPNFN